MGSIFGRMPNKLFCHLSVGMPLASGMFALPFPQSMHMSMILVWLLSVLAKECVAC
jgi:hypothetical protein